MLLVEDCWFLANQRFIYIQELTHMCSYWNATMDLTFLLFPVRSILGNEIHFLWENAILLHDSCQR